MFEETPIEIIFSIFSKMELYEVLALRGVNKFFRRAVEDYFREPQPRKKNSMLQLAAKNANLGRRFVLDLQTRTQRNFRFSDKIVCTSIPQGQYVGCDLKVGNTVTFCPRNHMVYRPLWGGDYYVMIGPNDGTQFLTLSGDLIDYEEKVVCAWKNRMFISKKNRRSRTSTSAMCDTETGQELIQFDVKIRYHEFQRPPVLSSEPAVMFAINSDVTHTTSIYDMRQSQSVLEIPDRPGGIDSLHELAFFGDSVVLNFSNALKKYDMRTGVLSELDCSYTNFGTPIPHVDEKKIFI